MNTHKPRANRAGRSLDGFRGKPALRPVRTIIRLGLRFILLSACGIFTPNSPLAADSEVPPDSLQARIQRACAAGDYDTALGLARALLSWLESESNTPAYDLRDAQLRAQTLERVRALPASDRNDLARADRMDFEMAEAYGRGEYAEAQRIVREQLAIRKRLLGDRHADVGVSWNNLSTALYATGRYAEAEADCRNAVAIFRELYGEESPNVAVGLSSLGMMLKDQGEYAAADSVLRRSLAINRRIHPEPHTDTVLSLGNLASVLQAEGDLRGTEALYREALAMQRKLLDAGDPALAVNLNNLALVLRLEGDYAGAEPLQRLALSIQQKALGPDHPDVGTSLHNLAYLLEAQGDLAGAEPLYRQALAAWAKSLGPEHPRIARTLSNLALVLQEEGNGAAADTTARNALAMYQRLFGPEHPLVVSSMEKRAELLAMRGDSSAARLLYNRVIALQRKILGPEHPDLALSMAGLARLRETGGDLAGAEKLYRRALAIRRDVLGDVHPAVVDNLTALGRVRRARGDDRGAEALLSEAARGYEVARSRSGGGLAGSTFLESPYPLLAAVRLELGLMPAAWDAVEEGQGRALVELLRASRRRLEPEESAREDSLSALLTRLEAQVPELEHAGARHSSEARDNQGVPTAKVSRRLLLETKDRLLSAQAAWSALQQEIAARHPLTEGRPFPLARVQASLDPATALIGWLDVPSDENGRGSWAYVIRSTGAVSWSEVSRERGRAYRDALVSAGSSPLGAPAQAEFLAEAQALWTERIAPVTRFLDGVQNLIVIPSGPMLGVPVEALADPSGRFLGDQYSVSYSPSATIYASLREERSRPAFETSRALLVGDPPPARSDPRGGADSLAGLPRLVWSRREVEGLSSLLPGSRLLVGPSASEQTLVELADSGSLNRYRIIHLAAHALVDNRRPERSAIVLSRVDLPDATQAALEGRRIYDGLLTAREIVHEWKLDSDLVALSACESALGREVAGEGYIGLADAFLQAGARCVLVSLWKVNDRATALLMDRFYANWIGTAGVSKAQALREAKEWLRSYRDETGRTPFAHQFYWAPFILIGDPG
jgi:CHAT domain-containing protein/tetratricopeptide (TPR) repeat protein